MIWIPFRLILMGGLVIDSGRTESGVIGTRVTRSENRCDIKTSFRHIHSLNRACRRCFLGDSSCTLALLFRVVRHFSDSGFTAVRAPVLFLVVLGKLAHSIHAFWAITKYQSCVHLLYFQLRGHLTYFCWNFNSLREGKVFCRRKCSRNVLMLQLVSPRSSFLRQIETRRAFPVGKIVLRIECVGIHYFVQSCL